MKSLRRLPLAELLRDVRTAERLAAAIPAHPREEAALHVAVVDALRASHDAELERRAGLVEAARTLPVRSG